MNFTVRWKPRLFGAPVVPQHDEKSDTNKQNHGMFYSAHMGLVFVMNLI
jgi:hypothetical protein